MKTIITLLLTLCATALLAQTNNDEHYTFRGLLNGKIPVEIAFQDHFYDKWRTAGYIYYPKAKDPAPILIVGKDLKVDPKLPDSKTLRRCQFTEYQNDGTITGIFELTYREKDGKFSFVKGTWTNPTTKKSLPMTDMQYDMRLPDWYRKAPTTLEAPDRKAYTFKHHFDKDTNGWLQKIHVDVYAEGRKQDMTISEDICGAFQGTQETELEWVTERDINFDGIPDLMVYIGMTHHGRSMYQCHVWNPQTRQFYYVPAFEEMQEPEFDTKGKSIVSYVRDVDYMYVETFKWKNGNLTKAGTKKISLHD
jgi:hypothetical protein